MSAVVVLGATRKQLICVAEVLAQFDFVAKLIRVFDPFIIHFTYWMDGPV